jgi:predicted metalloprotease
MRWRRGGRSGDVIDARGSGGGGAGGGLPFPIPTSGAAGHGDRIQRAATGQIRPETFTHGSSEDRGRWFRTGFDSGDANRCDTFS